jgi:cell division protein FtsL
MTSNNSDTFIKITNQDIYNELQSMHKTIEQMQSQITKRQDITNGRVKKSMWLATSAITLVLALFTFFIQHLTESTK